MKYNFSSRTYKNACFIDIISRKVSVLNSLCRSTAVCTLFSSKMNLSDERQNDAIIVARALFSTEGKSHNFSKSTFFRICTGFSSCKKSSKILLYFFRLSNNLQNEILRKYFWAFCVALPLGSGILLTNFFASSLKSLSDMKIANRSRSFVRVSA